MYVQWLLEDKSVFTAVGEEQMLNNCVCTAEDQNKCGRQGRIRIWGMLAGGKECYLKNKGT